MRLIDADKLKKVGLKLPFDGFNKTWLNNDDIDRQPTVDAVEVVRCKDCRWLENDGYHTRCRIMGLSVEAEDYCNRGERREDETD